jgi:hypothetical protein
MHSHVSGEFIAVIEIKDAFPVSESDFPNNDEGDKRIRQYIQFETLQRMNTIFSEISEKYGITIAVMPQYINGGMLEP